MKTFSYTIQDPVGIHARPAGILTRAAQTLPDQVTLTIDGRSADLKKLLAVMGLGIHHGDTVTVTVQGPDEDSSAAYLQRVFHDNV